MFDEALAPRSHPLMQDPAFAAALRLCGQAPVQLSGGLTVLQRRVAGVPLAMLPRAIPPPDLSRQLEEVGLHRRPLILSPERPCPLPFAVRLAGSRVRAVLTLDEDAAALRARLHPKWRNQLGAAEGRSVRVIRTRLPADPDSPVLATETAQSRARGYANWPVALTAAFAAVAPRQTHLFQAIANGDVVAHMLFLTHGSGATYHIGHITPRGKAVCAHNLILWEAARHLARLGCCHLDLGILDDSTPDLNRFKLRTGARQQKTGGTHLIWRPLAAL